jgi:hypothetical protein
MISSPEPLRGGVRGDNGTVTRRLLPPINLQDYFMVGEKLLSWLAKRLDREILFGFVAVFTRELFLREVRPTGP